MPEAAREQYELIVSGMSCDACLVKVEDALQQVQGVRGSRVDLESGQAIVEGGAVDSNQLVEAVIRAGYGVRSTRQLSGSSGSLELPR